MSRFDSLPAETLAWSAATSPLNRPTPTTLTGPLASRSAPPNAACHSPTIFDGMRQHSLR